MPEHITADYQIFSHSILHSSFYPQTGFVLHIFPPCPFSQPTYHVLPLAQQCFRQLSSHDYGCYHVNKTTESCMHFNWLVL